MLKINFITRAEQLI